MDSYQTKVLKIWSELIWMLKKIRDKFNLLLKAAQKNQFIFQQDDESPQRQDKFIKNLFAKKRRWWWNLTQKRVSPPQPKILARVSTKSLWGFWIKEKLKNDQNQKENFGQYSVRLGATFFSIIRKNWKNIPTRIQVFFLNKGINKNKNKSHTDSLQSKIYVFCRVNIYVQYSCKW